MNFFMILLRERGTVYSIPQLQHGHYGGLEAAVKAANSSFMLSIFLIPLSLWLHELYILIMLSVLYVNLYLPYYTSISVFCNDTDVEWQ